MGVAERIVERLADSAGRRRVCRVQAGLIYTAVQLDTGDVGVAYTFPQTRACGGPGCGGGFPLESRRAVELIGALGGNDLLASTVALATVNALLAGAPPPGIREADVLDSIRFRRGDRVCMVGCFAPLIAPLADLKVSLKTFDQIPKPGSRPAGEVEEHLPRSQVAIITATSLINNTLEHLLALASNCREVAVLGSSTPLIPEVFSGTPVSCLAGISMAEPEGVLRSISEGQGFCVFKRYVRKVSLRIT
jgi:uncharacterized protein (DUF4213/DUF364 family)